MVKCVFCGREEDAFKGTHLIQNDGTVNYYCSSKCRKNAIKLKRDKRKLKWTSAYREEKQKALKKLEDAAKPKVEEEKKTVKKKK